MLNNSRFWLMSFLRRQESILRLSLDSCLRRNDSCFAQKLSILILLFTLSSCDNPVPRRPVSNHSGSYMKESVALNKKINKLQASAIDYYIKKDSVSTYINSPDGFVYKYIHQKKEEKRTPKAGDKVFFEYEISDLTDHILYTEEELGENQLLIDKEDIESGLQNGLKLMKEGEEIVFIFPSYKAFGYIGDRERIGINQPLIYKVKLNKIINKNENN